MESITGHCEFAKMLRPPFPFPEKWEVVQQFQLHNNTLDAWSVPVSIVAQNDNVFNEKEYSIPALALKQCNILEENPIETCESSEVIEEFVMNEYWASRFSKTLKRIKKKAHKSHKRN